MKIQIRHSDEIPIEEAHSGAGSRKLFIGDKSTPSKRIQGMTEGWLPAGGIFDWHDHDKIEEIMYVLEGEGTVSDQDGEYEYKPGDICIFPANTLHKIANTTNEEHHYIFIRIYE